MLGGAIAAGEQGILARQSHRTHAALHGVGVELDAAVVEDAAAVLAGRS